MKQTDRLLAHFATCKSITPLQAWRELGIYRLGARVYDLREAGHKVDMHLTEVATAHGDVARVARYTYLGRAEG